MKMAISTVCMTEMDWRDAFKAAGSAGYRYVELLMVPNWRHVSPGQVDPDEMIRAAREAGVNIMGLHAGAIDGASDPSLAESVVYIERVVGEAVRLGVELVVFTAMPMPTAVQASRSSIHERIVRGLRTLQPRLDRENVRVGLENHHRGQIESIDDYESIFAGIGDDPHIGATIDTGHFTAAGIDPAAMVDALGRRVNHVHIKDHVGAQSVALGAGQTDNRAVVEALRRVGYHAWLTVELEVADRENAPHYVRESYPYMQRLLRE